MVSLPDGENDGAGDVSGAKLSEVLDYQLQVLRLRVLEAHEAETTCLVSRVRMLEARLSEMAIDGPCLPPQPVIIPPLGGDARFMKPPMQPVSLAPETEPLPEPASWESVANAGGRNCPDSKMPVLPAVVLLTETPALQEVSAVASQAFSDAVSTECDTQGAILRRWEGVVVRLPLICLGLERARVQDTQARQDASRRTSEEVKRLTSKDRGSQVVMRGNGPLACLTTSPASWKRTVWDMVAFAIVLYDFLTFPFIEAFRPRKLLMMSTVNLCATVFWIVDCVSQFFVGFYVDGLLEMRPAMTARKYLTGYFLFDFVVLVLDCLTVFVIKSEMAAGPLRTGKLGKLTKMGSALRFLRILRLLRMVKYKNFLWDATHNASSELREILLKFMRLMLIVLGIIHVLACIWFALGNHRWGDSESWIERWDLNAHGLAYKYTSSLHWALCQFTPASMEIYPINEYERSFAIVVVVFGMVAFSSFISSMTNLMLQLRNYGAAQKQREADLRRFLRAHNISNELTHRLKSFLNSPLRSIQTRATEADVELLTYIPELLRVDLHAEMYLPSLSKHPLFHFVALGDLSTIYLICHEITPRALHPDSVLFSAGGVASGMVFVVQGRLLYTTERPCGSQICSNCWLDTYSRSAVTLPSAITVGEGAWVVEAALWTSWVHYGYLIALSVCDLLELDAERFHRTIQNAEPGVRLAVKRYAAYFKAHMHEVGIGHCGGINDCSPEPSCVGQIAKQAFKFLALSFSREFDLRFHWLHHWSWEKKSR